MAASTTFEFSSPVWQDRLRWQALTEQFDYQVQNLFHWLKNLWPDRQPTDSSTDSGPWNWDLLHLWGYGLSVLVLGGLIGLILLYVVRLVRQTWRVRSLVQRRSSQVPPASAKSLADWLADARLAQQQGQYRLACQALYQAMLQRLDRQDNILFKSSRTDGEYLAILQQQPKADSYAVLIQTHEQLEFGQAPASEVDWTRCQQAYQTLDDLET